ncbi:cytochrome P450 [Syncephalastrum racemosum]|uniref:Cytochrome P450 n=1 Tax=Syncephalastrum racemosum TaxID=13706 RepID=A0A1X2HEF0_SYNRA|nr:cytochrome P450 [Syncephalastrum racemosum]
MELSKVSFTRLLWKVKDTFPSQRMTTYRKQVGKALSGCLLLYVIISRLYAAYWGPLKKIPGPIRFKFISLNYLIKDNPPGTFWKYLLGLHDQYGTVIRVGPNMLSVSDKDMIKQVLVKEDMPKGDAYGRIEKFHQNLFDMTHKADHKQRRRVLAPAFSMKYLKSLEPFMSQTTEALLNRIDRDIEATMDESGYGTVDLWVLLQCLAIDIIGETAFGQTFHMLEQSNHFVPATIDSFTKAGTYIAVHPIQGPIQVALSSTHLVKNMLKLRRFMRGIIEERIHSGEPRNDILKILIDSQKARDAEDRLSLHAIANETILFLIAGSETTSNTIGFVMIRLLQEPAVFSRLRHDIDQVPLKEGQVIFEHEHLKNIPYLDAVINETMRLDSIAASSLDRKATEDTLLGGRVFVPKGTTVLLNLMHAQTNEAYWPQAKAFIPERWLDDNKEHIVSADPDAFYPFSLGSRNCIGRNFAMQEMRLAIATLIKHYDFQSMPEELLNAEDRRAFITLGIANNSFKAFVKRREHGM